MIGTAEEFIRLLDSDSDVDRERVRYEEAPEAVWLEVIEQFPEARRAVVLNKTVPLMILQRLARSDDPMLRLDVAMKRKLDEETIRLLAADAHGGVRGQIARHHKAPRDVLEVLAQDPDWTVAEAAREKIRGGPK